MKCIFIFRRDLRLTDNTALIKVSEDPAVGQILPIFVYDVNQITSDHHSDFFLKAQEEALNDLDAKLKQLGSRLCRFYGTPYKVIGYLCEQWKPACIAFNLDYSTYSKKRDSEIARVAKMHDLKMFCHNDVTLAGEPFNKLFHIFAKAMLTKKVEVREFKTNKFVSERFKLEKLSIAAGQSFVPINRKWAIERVKKFCENPKELFDKSKIPGTAISAHLKLGLLSCREVYKYALTHSSGHLVKQMIWREFYFSLARENLNHYDFYDDRFKFMQWINDPNEIKAMWTGKTGFDIIDASMNELNKTGFMWNRGRLLVGFFSVKLLRINPFLPPNPEIHKWYMGGQFYFSKMLVDACYANNTGNWHWVASDTVDASGQRFGKGWSGRPNNVEKLHPATNSWCPSDQEYIAKWLPKKINEKIINPTERWNEWCTLTV